ncbi:MAG: Fic family protein [Bacilli bacterium]|nr:Fic family protein [Bacilli bacterium]
MEPYKAKLLPISYELDKETIKLLGQANDKYGQYKSLLKVFKFDQKFFLDSLVLGESIRSSRIEGTQISQDDMYYMDYKETNDSIKEVKNLKKMLEYANTKLKDKDFSIDMINKMHKILLSGTRGEDKSPGKIRTIQNYIGLRGLGKEGATFVPPIPEEVPELLDNLIEYMNNMYNDEAFIKVAISHVQFESIHPYNDGNGRMGRALMTLELAKLKGDEPILFLSEVIELFKANYYNTLTECRHGNVDGFIRFFLQCVVDQCTRNIGRIEKINRVYEEDEQTIKENMSGSIVVRMHPLMMKKIVFTAQDMADELDVHINSINKVLNRLIELNIIKKEKKEGTNRITYRYIRVYDTFVEQI